jgi:heme/copper-type cytochrome/quinol oxidase subunit 4
MNSRNQVVNAWLILIVLTTGSFSLVEGGVAGLIAAPMVIGIAAYKARLIMVHFMEINLTPRPWRAMYTSWTIVVATIILAGNYIAAFSS